MKGNGSGVEGEDGDVSGGDVSEDVDESEDGDVSEDGEVGDDGR